MKKMLLSNLRSLVIPLGYFIEESEEYTYGGETNPVTLLVSPEGDVIDWMYPKDGYISLDEDVLKVLYKREPTLNLDEVVDSKADTIGGLLGIEKPVKSFQEQFDALRLGRAS
jgi:hypothetical protein